MEKTTGDMTVVLNFSEEYIKYLKTKFDWIEDKDDLIQAIYECIETYMEL